MTELTHEQEKAADMRKILDEMNKPKKRNPWLKYHPQRLIRKAAREVNKRLMPLTEPYPDEIVSHLITHVSSLQLGKGELYEFAPIKGTCGTFKVTGTGLPVFTYNVFEKKCMEFIEVRVEISKPERIEYFAHIVSTTAPERNGEKVAVKPEYKEPFIQLSQHLFRYFPFYKRNR